MFFVASTAVVAMALSYAIRDLLVLMQVNNSAILGESFRLNSLLAVSIAIVLGIFFGVFYQPSRRYIQQCVTEFFKVAFPEWKETKMATFTVVLVSVVASLILGVFDGVFSWWTNNNLFIW